jgi:hypothetical protein
MLMAPENILANINNLSFSGSLYRKRRTNASGIAVFSCREAEVAHNADEQGIRMNMVYTSTKTITPRPKGGENQ